MKVRPPQINVTQEIRSLDAVAELPPAAKLPAKRSRSRKAGSRRDKQSIERVRASIATMLEENAPKFNDWFERAAAENPLKALVLMKDLIEYFTPKLGRIEQVGEVTHKVQHFVPLIQREERPAEIAAPDEAIDGEFTSLPPPKP